MADDGADEVKVFRGSNDAEDLDTTAQSSQQLAQDKKEVALETELEQKTINGVKSAFEAKAAASPSFAGLPFGALPPFSPSYGAFPTMFMGMPWLMNPMQPRMSPSFMPFMPAALSPSFGLQQLMMNGPASPLYGAMAGAAAKCGVPLPASMRSGGANPLNQINQMRLPYQNAMAHLAGGLGEQGETRKMKSERRGAKEDHIKKPLNAFMWYMKENRPKLLEELEYKEKQSAELNKELGRRWHALNKEDQQRYFDLAKADREEHRQKYPHWSAKENYRLHKKKKRNREKSVEETEVKKCRARFGMERTDLWCKFCKRKKKCEVFLRDRPDSVTSHGSSIGLDKALTPHRPGSTSHVAPLEFGVEHRMVGAGGSPTDDASDSESDIDDEVDDPSTLAALQEVAMQQESLMTL